ncbi:MAG: hypothetical protein QG660_950, partial [Pseudomonadota bacterium]|nr:hypothetical protein [Pseudomonadota bacterium]
MFSKIDPAATARAVAHHPRTRLWGKRFAIFMAIVGVLGFFAVPPLLKSVLLSKLGEALHRDVSIESISINPYTLTATLNGVSVRERAEGKAGEELFGFDSLRVNAELASLAVAGVVVKEIELTGPRVRLVRQADNRYNISDLIDEQMAKPPSNDPLPRFSVSNIQIKGGKVEFDDRPEGVKHAVTDITLQVPFLSTLSYYSDTYVEPHFSASINGAPLELAGKSRPFGDSQESELTLNLDNLQLGRYLAYSPVDLPIKVLSGAVDGDLRLRFVQTKKQPSTLSLAGKVEVKELKVEETGGLPLLGMKRLEVVLREVDLLKLGVGVESVLVESPEVDVRISKQGVLNWLALVPATAEKAPEPVAEKKASPLLLTVASIAVKDGVINIQDQSTAVEQKGSIKNFQVDASNFDSSGAKPLEFAVGWRVDAGERLAVEQVKVSEGRLDLNKHTVSIGEFSSQGVRAKLTRGKDGSIQWFKSPALRVAQAARKEKEEPWQVSIARLKLQDQQYQFEDRKFSTAATQTLELTSLEAENISTLPDTEAKLSAKLRINKKGELDVEGNLKPMLPQGELRLDMRGIELLPFQPYFSEFLNITVTRGQVAAKGAVSVAKAKEGVSAGYKGDLTLGNFHSVDKANSADFLKWKSFYFGGIDVQTAPLSVAVGEVALSDFYARVIVSPEGKLNLMNIVKGDESAKVEKPAEGAPAADATVATAPVEPVVSVAPAASAGDGKAVAPVADKPAKEVIPVKIGKVTLQGGNINFSDNFIKPNYSANLTKIGGRVTGLSSTAGSTADMELRGSYDNLAPLNISAKLNPFAAKSYLDLDAEVKGIELTGFSTYSGKYAGYAIERGKLSLFLKYKIDNNQLSADNRVFLDQLTFGDEVDSPEATKLPVRLAVSLLQNRKGEIDINLPISGSLDDPQFSVGGIIVQVILNVFTKAITSPFALIGSLFGGGEELSYVEFDYGYSTISAKMKERLQTVAKVLDDRPAIRIEIAGRIDSERDREGLKRALMERRVKAQRLEELVKAGTEAGSLDEVEIPAKDYPKYLERAYKAEKFPKPRNMIGLVKDLPVEEMEKLMMANMKADDEALRDLADRRAKSAGEWL